MVSQAELNISRMNAQAGTCLISYFKQVLFYNKLFRVWNPSPRGSTVLHIWWCRWSRCCHSSPRGCWCWWDDSPSCIPAPPPPVPALLPWQPAASSAGCNTDACHKRGSGLASGTSNNARRANKLMWINMRHCVMVVLDLQERFMFHFCTSLNLHLLETVVVVVVWMWCVVEYNL